MGVNLTPIIVKKVVELRSLRGKIIAVDASVVLHQFLSLIRLRDGTPLKDSQGNITSHLEGLAFRSTRLISDYGMELVFVFDGEPPPLKKSEIERRRRLRDKALKAWEEALRTGDYSTAFSKAVMTSRLTSPMTEDAKRLLTLLGIPWVQAPSEGEAQAAYMASRGAVWAAGSQDYDALLFGAPHLVRYITISGREYLPSKGTFRPLKPEIISMSRLFSELGVDRRQLIDIAILVGTDFNKGVHGIGPKTALKLVKEHRSLENLPAEVRSELPPSVEEIRRFFMWPEVTSEYDLTYGELREGELIAFLCGERDFSRERVKTIVDRMKRFYARKSQEKLDAWFGK